MHPLFIDIHGTVVKATEFWWKKHTIAVGILFVEVSRAVSYIVNIHVKAITVNLVVVTVVLFIIKVSPLAFFVGCHC